MFNRSVRSFVLPLAALGLMISSHSVKAEDAPVTPAATGTVQVKVVKEDGTAAASVQVRIVSAADVAKAGKSKKADPAKPTEPQDKAAGDKPPKAAKNQPTAVAQGTTDADGKVTLSSVPAGDFVAIAGSKTDGRGRADVKVIAGQETDVTITLKPAKKATETPAAAPK